jgi:hypothetical protein
MDAAALLIRQDVVHGQALDSSSNLDAHNSKQANKQASRHISSRPAVQKTSIQEQQQLQASRLTQARLA